MRIHSFGHSCFLLEIAGDRPEPVRILADPWLSDHVVGDLCGRFPRIRIDWERLPPIDAVYISHSHTDHLDPYSLVQLRERLPEPPLLLLPASLRYLEPLFEEHLGSWPRVVLDEDEPVDLDGVEISALFNLETRATNEDDVMVLVVRSGSEVLVSESDALLPFADPEARESIASLFLEVGDTGADGSDGGAPSRVFLTTRNELAATMASLRALSPEERRAAAQESAAETLAEIDSIFAPAGGELAAPWDLPGMVRLVIGQGIAWPQQLDPEWNRVLFPISLSDRVAFERQVAASCGYDLPIEALHGGESVRIEGGVVRRGRIPWLEALDHEEQRRFDPSLDLWESVLPVAPLRDAPRDTAAQRVRILEVLNSRFLPWWIGSRNPPVEHLLSRGEGEYRIRVRFGSPRDPVIEDYVAGFARLRFEPAEPTGDPQRIDEEYWANDLEDYLDGLADDFSTFCRRPPGGRATRLWDSLGMPYLNDDLVARKHALHFRRAEQGLSSEEWVLALWRGDASVR
jgi:hypothetical protein